MIFTFCVAFFSLMMVPVACSDDEKAVTPEEKKYASYDIDWTAAADSVSTAFIERFYNGPNASGVFSYTDYNWANNNGNCYWQQAHAMAAMVDYYNRIKSTDSATAAQIESYFQKWYDKRGNNYEGNSFYRGSTGFGNDFTDDTCWIIIALLQMYDATGNTTYYTAAKTTWDECVRPRFGTNQYGWLPWKWTDSGANECTNGPGAIVAATLAGYAKAAGNDAEYEKYINEAFTCFDQNLYVMNTDGTLGSVPLSYTQGTCMEAGRLIWTLTGELGYLRKAILAARGQMTSSGMNVTHNGEYVMRDEGTDGNNAIFHAVFYHWAARMATDTNIDAYDSTIRTQLKKYLLRHASYYWTEGISKGPADWDNSFFSVLVYEERDPSERGELGAYTSAAQALETMCIIEKAE